MTDTNTLTAALVAALGELPDITKARTANAGTYSYTYAGLADVLGVVRPVLAGHGLAITQRATTDLVANTVTVETIILHTSGEERDGGQITFPLGQTAQATGSTISYARRYAILTALGIAGADDDDDGQAASTTPRPSTSTRERAPRPVSKVQLKKLGALFDAAGIEREHRHELVAGVIGRPIDTSGDLTADEASTAIDAVQAVVDGSATIEVTPEGAWLLNAATRLESEG